MHPVLYIPFGDHCQRPKSIFVANFVTLYTTPKTSRLTLKIVFGRVLSARDGGLFSNSKLVSGGIVHLQLYRLVFFEHETRKQKLPNLHQAAFIFFKCWWCASLQQYDITGILRYLGSLATKSTIRESSGANSGWIWVSSLGKVKQIPRKLLLHQAELRYLKSTQLFIPLQSRWTKGCWKSVAQIYSAMVQEFLSSREEKNSNLKHQPKWEIYWRLGVL